jgi:trigger factor
MTPSTPTIIRLPGGRAQATVVFTKEQVAAAEERALKRLGSNVKIPGFRVGHVPVEQIRARVKPDELFEETIRTLMPEMLRGLIEANQLRPIIPPKAEVTSQDPLTITVTFVEHPEVTVATNNLAVEKQATKLDEKDVQKMVDYILEQHRETASVDRAAKEGDEVVMDFSAVDESGKDIEGARAREYRVIVGSKSLIPGFEENLIGMKPGETKSFQITFPEKYQAEALRGKKATFAVTVTKVHEVHKPELTDEFAKTTLRAGSAVEFRERVTGSMREQEEQIERQRREQAVLEKIAKATKVAIAPELQEAEEQRVLEELAHSLEQEGVTFEQYLERSGKKPEDMKKEIQERAKGRLTLRFGVEKLLHEKGISISDDEMVHIAQELLAPLDASEHEKIAPHYQKGKEPYEQLRWEKRVERLMNELLK